ncbi:Nucleophile aminohydrolase [Phytophthora cactorum]|nr:Nucleophile aminohydrolase [Phytophthora cactorum]
MLPFAFRAASNARKDAVAGRCHPNFGAAQVARFSDAPTMHGTTILCVRKNGKVNCYTGMTGVLILAVLRLNPGQCLIGDGQVSWVTPWSSPTPRRCVASVSTSWRVLPAPRPTPSRSWSAWRPSWTSTGPAHPLVRGAGEGLADGQVPTSSRGHPNRLGRQPVVHAHGNGDVLEPHDGIIGIGSGGTYALAAARALIDQDLDAETIARKAMKIAADICVYTNGNVVVEMLEEGKDDVKEEKKEKAT